MSLSSPLYILFRCSDVVLSLCICNHEIINNPARRFNICSAWDVQVSGQVGYNLLQSLSSNLCGVCSVLCSIQPKCNDWARASSAALLDISFPRHRSIQRSYATYRSGYQQLIKQIVLERSAPYAEPHEESCCWKIVSASLIHSDGNCRMSRYK